VVKLGSGNTHGIAEGMRVALPWLGYACGDCRYCNAGRETLCESQLNMGYPIDGGFAEFAVGYARHVVPVPEEIDPLDAAPLTCAGATTFKAVKISGAGSSDLVAVFGAGGLGHLAIQYAAIAGASVVAVDVNPRRLETARHPGLRRPAGRERDEAADLRDGARWPQRPRLDRRHPPHPAGQRTHPARLVANRADRAGGGARRGTDLRSCRAASGGARSSGPSRPGASPARRASPTPRLPPAACCSGCSRSS
jgi:hypothetical protein